VDADRSSGFILQPGEGRSIDLGGFQMTVKATSEKTGGAFSLLEADEPPESKTQFLRPSRDGRLLRRAQRRHQER
jgi:hypothetical protein